MAAVWLRFKAPLTDPDSLLDLARLLTHVNWSFFTGKNERTFPGNEILEVFVGSVSGILDVSLYAFVG